jgi:uncharacterized protein (TIGR02284 family)
METKEIIETMNDLIVACHDGHKGYQEAARGVEDIGIRGLFGRFALQRRQFAEELVPIVVRMGGKAKKGGSARAAVHRDLIDLKKAATGGDIGGIFEECERGDLAAIRTYEQALAKGLPAAEKDIVAAQAAALRAAVAELRDFVKRSTSARPLPQESRPPLRRRDDRVAPPARQTPRPD